MSPQVVETSKSSKRCTKADGPPLIQTVAVRSSQFVRGGEAQLSGKGRVVVIKSYIFSFILPGLRLFHQVRFHIFPVTGIVREQKPMSINTDVVDGVSSVAEMVGNRFAPVVFYVSQVFFEAGIKGASSFAEAESGAFGAMNNVHDVVRLAVELFGDVRL